MQGTRTWFDFKLPWSPKFFLITLEASVAKMLSRSSRKATCSIIVNILFAKSGYVGVGSKQVFSFAAAIFGLNHQIYLLLLSFFFWWPTTTLDEESAVAEEKWWQWKQLRLHRSSSSSRLRPFNISYSYCGNGGVGGETVSDKLRPRSTTATAKEWTTTAAEETRI